METSKSGWRNILPAPAIFSVAVTTRPRQPKHLSAAGG